MEFAAKGMDVWVKPEQTTGPDGSTRIKVGFKACTVNEQVRHPEVFAETIAEALNKDA